MGRTEASEPEAADSGRPTRQFCGHLVGNAADVLIYSRDELDAVSIAIQTGPSRAAERRFVPAALHTGGGLAGWSPDLNDGTVALDRAIEAKGPACSSE